MAGIQRQRQNVASNMSTLKV